MKKIISIGCLLLLTTLLPVAAYSQDATVRFEDLDSLQKKEQRITMVFIHTDWCKYCQAMKQITFKNKAVAEALKDSFYVVSLNAEDRHDITFNNRTFRYKPRGQNTGLHELATQLATIKADITYPTLCFLNADNEIIYQTSGFLNSVTMGAILNRLLATGK